MKYDIILLDADETILDFKQSENYSLKRVLNQHGLDSESTLLKSSYQKINEELWKNHALGLLSKDLLKTERFRLFLEENNLAGDALLMGEDYLRALPEKVFLIDGAYDFLAKLHQKIPLVIVTNGIGYVQNLRLEKSGLKHFIDLMVISEECGFSKPDKRIFEHTFKLIGKPLSQTRALMIGDRIETDILGAINAGLDSCWFNPNGDKNQTPHRPTFEVSSLDQIHCLL